MKDSEKIELLWCAFIVLLIFSLFDTLKIANLKDRIKELEGAVLIWICLFISSHYGRFVLMGNNSSVYAGASKRLSIVPLMVRMIEPLHILKCAPSFGTRRRALANSLSNVDVEKFFSENLSSPANGLSLEGQLKRIETTDDLGPPFSITHCASSNCTQPSMAMRSPFLLKSSIWPPKSAVSWSLASPIKFVAHITTIACAAIDLIGRFKGAFWVTVLLVSLICNSSATTLDRSIRFVKTNRAVSLDRLATVNSLVAARFLDSESSSSTADASISSQPNPTIRRTPQNFFQLSPFMSFQSQATSPRTPASTAINPGCSLTNAQYLHANKTEAKIARNRIARRILLGALSILLISKTLRLFVRQK